MVYGFTTNHGRKYPYYICLTAQKRGAKACPGQVITAVRIEKSIVLALCERANSESTGELHPFSLGWAHWTAVSHEERRRMVVSAIERIGYDHRMEQAQIRLRAETGELDRELRVRIRKSPFGRRRAEDGEPPSNEELSVVETLAEPNPASSEGQPPRITRLMALAIRFERLLREGVARDYADLARLGGVTRPRITQIMNMRNLAPSIQEEILFLPTGSTPINERGLRQLADELDWHRQLRQFAKLRSTAEVE